MTSSESTWAGLLAQKRDCWWFRRENWPLRLHVSGYIHDLMHSRLTEVRC